MNKRIRELAREAGIKMAQDQSMALGYLDTKHKKFAKLIIQECANIDFGHHIDLSDDQIHEVSRLIRDHFEVNQ